MATESLQQYAKAADRKADLEAELLEVKAKLTKLEPLVLDWFQREGVQNIRINGRTLHLRRELWAGRAEGVSNDDAIEALQAAGLDDFAAPRINTQKLSAWCRERDAEGEALPPEFEGVLVVNEKFKVGSRKG